MKLFDLHCDTAYEMYKQNQGFEKNDLHISLSKAKDIEKYIQILAVWCDNKKGDEECFEEFLKIHSNILKHTELITNSCEENRGFYLSVEDARLIAGKIERLDVLYEMGVRFLIPMWSGKSCIGGAFDSDEGLTDFGKEVIKRCFDIGIIPDISHASIKSANDIFNIAEGVRKPVIASHSCSFAAYHHARNLRDDQFERIKSLGGIVGLSFCRYHLTNKNDKCNTDNILAHLEHYLEIGGEDTVCFGADMDGAPMPDDIKGIESVPMLYEKLCDRFGRAVSDKITYQNAYNFVKLNLK